MDPMTISALIGAGGSAASGLLNLFGQQDSKNNSTRLANEQLALQKLLANRQYDLATAGRTTARGDNISYVPGKGWVETPTDTTRSIIGSSDAVQRQQLVDMLTRGRGERDLALDRRLEEGSVADPLLQQIKYGFGAPTKEGVVGADKISRVTGVGEAADNAKGGVGAAFLRTGMNVNPTALSNIDRGAATGVRKALADSDANADPLFQAHMASFTKNKMDPYNVMATRASNIENIPFQPEQLSANLDANAANAAAVAGTRGAGGSEGLYRGFSPLINLANDRVNYDTFAGGLTENLKNLLRGWGTEKTPSGLPKVGEDGRPPSHSAVPSGGRWF